MPDPNKLVCPSCRREAWYPAITPGVPVQCPACNKRIPVPPAPPGKTEKLPPPLPGPPLVVAAIRPTDTHALKRGAGSELRRIITAHPFAFCVVACTAILGLSSLGRTAWREFSARSPDAVPTGFGIPTATGDNNSSRQNPENVYPRDYDYVIRKYLRENANDQSKLEIIRIAPPIPLEETWIYVGDAVAYDLALPEHSKRQIPACWQRPTVSGFAVQVKFRDATEHGGIKLNAVAFFLDESNRITRTIPAEDLRATRPGRAVSAVDTWADRWRQDQPAKSQDK